MFGGLKFRVVNPELLSIAHRDAGRVALYFAAEFVRLLKPDFARAADRFVHQLNRLLFLEIGLHLRRAGAAGADLVEKGFDVGGESGSACASGEDQGEENVRVWRSCTCEEFAGLDVLRFCRGCRGQGEKNRGKKAPGQPDRAGDAETAEGGIIGQA